MPVKRKLANGSRHCYGNGLGNCSNLQLLTMLPRPEIGNTITTFVLVALAVDRVVIARRV